MARPRWLEGIRSATASASGAGATALPSEGLLVAPARIVSPGLNYARRTTGGTIEACRAALREGVAANLAGGTHHAFPDAGEGFCIFNDAAVALRAMQAEGRIRKALEMPLPLIREGLARLYDQYTSGYRDRFGIATTLHAEKVA